MPDELTELLDTAIYKEIASEVLYSAAQGKTDDPGAKALLKELAAEEKGHQSRLK
jgi:rubrerythrin